ncbi:hypothetical protein ACP70R_027054 [Stipagrostis hirtigluma subsp. patula]
MNHSHAPLALDVPAAVHRQQPRRHHPDVFVRPVRASNLAAELSAISSLLPRYPYVTVHAEYPAGCGDDDAPRHEHRLLVAPGGVLRDGDLSPEAPYRLAKIDIDTHPVLHLGITLCDDGGALPVLPCGPRGPAAAVWQVAFRGADARHGVALGAFSAALLASGVVSGETRRHVKWVAFGGLRHFGFLLKALTGGEPLPRTGAAFAAALEAFLGPRVFDARYVAARLPLGVRLEGDLAHVARLLDAPAAAAREPRQAGEKSLAACQVFMRTAGLFFAWGGIGMHAGRIHGLHS